MIDISKLTDMDCARAAQVYESTINEQRPGVNGDIAAVKAMLAFCETVSESRTNNNPLKPV